MCGLFYVWGGTPPGRACERGGTASVRHSRRPDCSSSKQEPAPLTTAYAGVVWVVSRIRSPARRSSRHPSPPLVSHLFRDRLYQFRHRLPPASCRGFSPLHARRLLAAAGPAADIRADPLRRAAEPGRSRAPHARLHTYRLSRGQRTLARPHPLLRVRLSRVRARAPAGIRQVWPSCGAHTTLRHPRLPTSQSDPPPHLDRKGGGRMHFHPPIDACECSTRQPSPCDLRVSSGIQGPCVGRCRLSRRRVPSSVRRQATAVPSGACLCHPN